MNLPPEVLAAIDKYAKEYGMTREFAAAYILKDWLISHGYMPFDEDDEGLELPE